MHRSVYSYEVTTWHNRHRGSSRPRLVQIDFGLDRQTGRKLNLPLYGGELDCTHVAGRPRGPEQLLGGRVRCRQFDIEMAVAATRGTIPAIGRVGFAGEEEFLGHGKVLSTVSIN